MSHDKIDTLNTLLRGERSAAETYAEAVKKVDDKERLDPILEIKADHHQAVQELQKTITKHGGKPDSDSGAWGTWAKTVTKSATLFGDKATLKALKEGEEHGLKEYNDALEDGHFDDHEKQMLQSFASRQKSHISTIDRYL